MDTLELARTRAMKLVGTFDHVRGEMASSEVFERVRALADTVHAFQVFGGGPQVIAVFEVEESLAGELRVRLYDQNPETQVSLYPVAHDGEYSRDTAQQLA